jgi:hypothetical protein
VEGNGEKIKAEIAKLLAAPGPDVWVISIHGTGHMSYSYAPFTMPGTVSKFGGTFLDPGKALQAHYRDRRGILPACFRPEEQLLHQTIP